jgi:hypothetical protein
MARLAQPGPGSGAEAAWICLGGSGNGLAVVQRARILAGESLPADPWLPKVHGLPPDGTEINHAPGETLLGKPAPSTGRCGGKGP